jgi:hypothetical protein
MMDELTETPQAWVDAQGRFAEAGADLLRMMKLNQGEWYTLQLRLCIRGFDDETDTLSELVVSREASILYQR